MIYGFPMNDAITDQIAEKSFPILPEVQGRERKLLESNRIWPVLDEIEDACGDVWDIEYVKSMAGVTPDSEEVGVLVVGWGKHIPEGENLDALNKVMAERGFHEEPGWFRRFTSLSDGMCLHHFVKHYIDLAIL